MSTEFREMSSEESNLLILLHSTMLLEIQILFTSIYQKKTFIHFEIVGMWKVISKIISMEK